MFLGMNFKCVSNCVSEWLEIGKNIKLELLDDLVPGHNIFIRFKVSHIYHFVSLFCDNSSDISKQGN